MTEKLFIWTYHWVPEGPRGFVRDLRLRWAAEEASFSYEVRTVPFEDRETNHLDRQHFGQVLNDLEELKARHLPAGLSEFATGLTAPSARQRTPAENP